MSIVNKVHLSRKKMLDKEDGMIRKAEN
jgi:hypothetical protein